MNRNCLLLLIAVITFRCNTKTKEEQPIAKVVASWNPPPTGTLIDKYEEKIAEDKLNNSYFRVAITSNDSSNRGYYTASLEKGANKNETDIEMPKWTKGVVVRPVLKKGQKPYQCLLGFDAGDGKFRDLYLIRINEKGSIVMKQIEAYY